MKQNEQKHQFCAPLMPFFTSYSLNHTRAHTHAHTVCTLGLIGIGDGMDPVK